MSIIGMKFLLVFVHPDEGCHRTISASLRRKRRGGKVVRKQTEDWQMVGVRQVLVGGSL